MFYCCKALSDVKPLEKWNVSKSANFTLMFSSCKKSLNLKELEKWDLPKGIKSFFPSL